MHLHGQQPQGGRKVNSGWQIFFVLHIFFTVLLFSDMLWESGRSTHLYIINHLLARCKMVALLRPHLGYGLTPAVTK